MISPNKSEPFIPSPAEWEVVEQLAQQQGLSAKAVLRQALRLYQLHCHRLAAGETCTWSGDAQRAAEFAGPLAEG